VSSRAFPALLPLSNISPASADGFSLFHHLIPVAALSREISLKGSVFKERIKICALKSPLKRPSVTVQASATGEVREPGAAPTM
jgi:hypothetical protein